MIRNLGLRGLSLVIALALYWFAHSQSNTSVIALVMPVEITNLPEEKLILLPKIRQAIVTIKGPSFLVREVSISSPSFTVNLPGDVGDTYTVSLVDQDLPIPDSVEIVSVEPPELELILDNVVTKAVPVEVPRIGKLNESLKLREVIVEPPMIDVRGAETEVRGIRRIETHPLDLRNINESQTLILGLSPVGKFSRPKVDSVKVRLEVRSVSANRKMRSVPVEVRSINGGSYAVFPTEVKIEIAGPKSLVKDLEKAQIVPYVRLDDVGEGKQEVEVQVDAPDKISVIAVEPAMVKLIAIVPKAVPGASLVEGVSGNLTKSTNSDKENEAPEEKPS